MTFVLCVGVTAAIPASAEPDAFAGRRLADVLRTLADRGLRIVFSSETVTPSMRVISEPPAGNPWQILQAILKPHALEPEGGPGGVIQIVRTRAGIGKSGAPPRTVPPRTAGAAGATYAERVVVTAPARDSGAQGVGSERTMSSSELQTLSGITTGDPFRAVQALPGVTSVGDFQSEFSVRGSPSRHIGVVVDGVTMPWARHAVYGREDLGSIAMLNPDVIGETTLLAGAYPQHHRGYLGAELRLSLREGSRSGTRVSGSIGGTYAALLAEGPIGGAARGSWLLAARQSHRDWPLHKRTVDGAVLGFSDAHARVVYDVGRGQQMSVTWLGGRTGGEGPDAAAPGGLAHATTTMTLLSAAWRSAPADRYVITQRVHTSAREYRNKYPTGEDFVRGADRAFAYRTDILHSRFGGILDAGGQVERTQGSRLTRDAGRIAGSAWHRSAYASFARTFAAVSLTSGINVAASTLVEKPALSKWLLAEWRARPRWTVIASAGGVSQFPELEHVLGPQAGDRLRPEHAAMIDVAVAREVGNALRLKAGLYASREHNLIVFEPEGNRNAATRSSRGFEVSLGRRRAAGLSGWIAYAYGRSLETDEDRRGRETYWSDFDQRHGLNVVGRYALSDRASASFTLRTGTNFPVAGRVAQRDGRLVAGAERNAVRLPPYARLDARAQREFEVKGKRLTTFVEMLNVLNRTNRGRAEGFVRFDGEATGFSEPLFPRLATAGLRIDLGPR